MPNEIDITGIDKATLLAALYNNSIPVGLGYLQASPEPMSAEEAARIIEEQGLRFDYLRGRPMKIRLDRDSLNPGGYDEYIGPGSAAKVIEAIKCGHPQPETPKNFGKALHDFLKTTGPTLGIIHPETSIFEVGLNSELEQTLEKSYKKFQHPGFWRRRALIIFSFLCNNIFQDQHQECNATCLNRFDLIFHAQP